MLVYACRNEDLALYTHIGKNNVQLRLPFDSLRIFGASIVRTFGFCLFDAASLVVAVAAATMYTLVPFFLIYLQLSIRRFVLSSSYSFGFLCCTRSRMTNKIYIQPKIQTSYKPIIKCNISKNIRNNNGIQSMYVRMCVCVSSNKITTSQKTSIRAAANSMVTTIITTGKHDHYTDLSGSQCFFSFPIFLLLSVLLVCFMMFVFVRLVVSLCINSLILFAFWSVFGLMRLDRYLLAKCQHFICLRRIVRPVHCNCW